MVMICSLMFYAVLEHWSRQGLVEKGRSVADMKKEAVPNADSTLDIFTVWRHP